MVAGLNPVNKRRVAGWSSPRRRVRNAALDPMYIPKPIYAWQWECRACGISGAQYTHGWNGNTRKSNRDAYWSHVKSVHDGKTYHTTMFDLPFSGGAQAPEVSTS